MATRSVVVTITSGGVAERVLLENFEALRFDCARDAMRLVNAMRSHWLPIRDSFLSDQGIPYLPVPPTKEFAGYDLHREAAPPPGR